MTDQTFGSIEAERSLLGGIFLDNEAIQDVQDEVSGDDFWVPEHRHVYEAMLAVRAEGSPVNRTTVRNRLVKVHHRLEFVGGDVLLDYLDKVVPSAANLSYYARIVREKARLRVSTLAAIKAPPLWDV